MRSVGFFGRSGEPITAAQWSQLLADPAYQHLASDDVGAYRVLTLWLGIDGPDLIGSPEIFETLVYAPAADAERLSPDLQVRRYGTEEAALRGHDEVVTLLHATSCVDVDTLIPRLR